MKNQYIREVASKGRAWTVSRFKRRLEEKEGVVFLRGCDTPLHTMVMFLKISEQRDQIRSFSITKSQLR